MKTLLPLLSLALLCAGCYTDSTGKMQWGRRRGPTQAELREQQLQARLAALEAKYGALQGDLEGMGSSVTSIALRSDEISRATDARGADAVALRNDQAAFERRLSALEAQMAKMPATIRTAVQNEHKAIVSEVNQAIAASDKRTEAAIKSAVAQAGRASGGGSSSSRGASRPTDGGQYYEHKVGAGQTVSEIARAYGVTIADVARANNLKAPNYPIRENQTLWIPAK